MGKSKAWQNRKKKMNPKRMDRKGYVMDDMKKLLNTLKSIDGTLKRIEQKMDSGKQHDVIKEAVSHALLGEKKGE